MRAPRVLALTLALLPAAVSVAAAQTDPAPPAPVPVTAAPATSSATTTPVTTAPALPQGQASVAVGTFRCKAAKCFSGLGEGIADAMTTALLNTGKFAVYERENTGQLTEEAFFGGGTAFEGAELLIFGSITQYEPEASSGGVNFLGISLGKQSSTVGIDLRIVDAKTRRIIGAAQVVGQAEGNNFNISTLLPVQLGGRSSPQVEAAISQMLNNAVQQLLLKIPAAYYKP